MKLPDFTKDKQFIELRRKMGIPDEYIAELSVSEIGLLRGGGIDVKLKDISVHKDGTFLYKGLRVLIYIRDVHQIGLDARMPRYHLADCKKIQEMRERNRFERYVNSIDATGTFKVNYIRNGRPQSKDLQLPVCRYCLALLGLCGYRSSLPETQKDAIVRDFTPGMFFERYPMTLYSRLPRDFADSSDINDYPVNWDVQSERIRRKAGWRCSKCDGDLSSYRRLLHVHHEDGDRRNNRESNLKVLCVRCHADEANHEHMKRDPHYRECMRIMGFQSR